MTNNKQQTIVEWLYDELFKSFEKFHTIQFTMEEYQANNVKLYLQAQAMHKQEIINSFFEGAYGGDNISGEQYYEQTYGGDIK